MFVRALAGIVAAAFLVGCDGETGVGATPRGNASGDSQTQVGMRRVAYFDTERAAWSGPGAPRPINAWMWHPSSTGGASAPFQVPADKPIFNGGRAMRDAEIAPGRRPLVILSHGTGGSAFQMMWLGRRLVEAGFIAVAVDHHGNTAAEDAYDPRGFLFMWERPQDVSVLIDALFQDDTVAPFLDPESVFAAGFSLGGYTVIANIGGRIDFEKFEAFCASEDADATCAPQPEYPEAFADLDRLIQADPGAAPDAAVRAASYRDNRIKAAVAIAPAVGQAFSTESLANIDVPLLVIGGEADKVAPIATNAAVIVEGVANAELRRTPAAHYSFLNRCTPRGRRFVTVCKDPDGVVRSDLHDEVANAAIKFFKDASVGSD